MVTCFVSYGFTIGYNVGRRWRQEILNGARMNLPLMEEVTKKAQKAKADNQTSLFGE